MSDLIIKYSNRPGMAITTILTGLVLGGVMGFFAVVAEDVSFDAFGRVIDGWQARAAVWAVVAVMAAMAAFGAYILISFRTTVRRVKIGPTSITAPKTPLSTTFVEVPYADITSVQATPIYRDIVLVIKYPTGSIRIPRLYLEDSSTFARIEAEVMQRWQAFR